MSDRDRLIKRSRAVLALAREVAQADNIVDKAQRDLATIAALLAVALAEVSGDYDGLVDLLVNAISEGEA